MMILKAFGKTYNCTSIVKTNNSSIQFTYPDETGNEITDTHSGINDLSAYSLVDEDGNSIDFPKPDPDEITQIQLAMAELYEGVYGNG